MQFSRRWAAATSCSSDTKARHDACSPLKWPMTSVIKASGEHHHNTAAADADPTAGPPGGWLPHESVTPSLGRAHCQLRLSGREHAGMTCAGTVQRRDHGRDENRSTVLVNVTQNSGVAHPRDHWFRSIYRGRALRVCWGIRSHGDRTQGQPEQQQHHHHHPPPKDPVLAARR